MFKGLIFVCSLYFFSMEAFALDAKVFCEQEFIDELRGFERDQIEESCKYVGQYENSVLPDSDVMASEVPQKSAVLKKDYSDFLKTLNKALNQAQPHPNCDSGKLNNETFVAYPNTILEKTAAGPIPVSVIDEKELKKIFKDIAENPKYSFQSVEEGCWARAHVMARELEKRGIRVAKIFVEGDLEVESKNALNGKGVVWKYHVAPVIGVQTAKGIQLEVIDPSLFKKSVPIKSWTDKLLLKTKDKEQVQVYLTDRFVLDPLWGDSLKSISEQPDRGRWHKFETTMAEQELQRNQAEEEAESEVRRYYDEIVNKEK